MTGLLILLSLIMVGVGLPLCFYGYKIFKFLLAFGGFLVGGFLGFVIIGLLTMSPEGAIIGGLILGVIGAVIAYVFHYVGVFVWGGFIGMLIFSPVILLLLATGRFLGGA